MTTTAAARPTACKDCGVPFAPRDKTLPEGHRRNIGRGLCGVCYDRTRNRTAAARAAADNSRLARIPRGCTALEGTPCTCYGCALAASDRESPAALVGGTWALNPTTKTREWRAS